MPVIGFLSVASPKTAPLQIQAFRDGLSEANLAPKFALAQKSYGNPTAQRLSQSRRVLWRKIMKPKRITVFWLAIALIGQTISARAWICNSAKFFEECPTTDPIF